MTTSRTITVTIPNPAAARERLVEALAAHAYAGMGYAGAFAKAPPLTRERYLGLGEARLLVLADPALRADLCAFVAGLGMVAP